MSADDMIGSSRILGFNAVTTIKQSVLDATASIREKIEQDFAAAKA